MGKIDAITKSEHSAKDADKHGINGVSGHDVSLLNNKGHYKGHVR